MISASVLLQKIATTQGIAKIRIETGDKSGESWICPPLASSWKHQFFLRNLWILYCKFSAFVCWSIKIYESKKKKQEINQKTLKTKPENKNKG